MTLDVADRQIPDDETIPGTVFTPRQARLLKNTVIVMGVMLIAGFALLVTLIVFRATNPPETKPAMSNRPAAAAPALTANLTTEILLPAGIKGEVGALTLDGDRLAASIKDGARREILILDLRTGRLLSRIRFSSE